MTDGEVALNDAQKKVILDKTLAAIRHFEAGFDKEEPGKKPGMMDKLKKSAAKSFFNDFAARFEDGARYKPEAYYKSLCEFKAMLDGVVAEVEAAK